MISRQLRRVHAKIKSQASAIFGKKKETQFVESVYNEQSGVADREQAITLITLVIRRLNQVRLTCGDEEVWNILNDGVSKKVKS